MIFLYKHMNNLEGEWMLGHMLNPPYNHWPVMFVTSYKQRAINAVFLGKFLQLLIVSARPTISTRNEQLKVR